MASHLPNHWVKSFPIWEVSVYNSRKKAINISILDVRISPICISKALHKAIYPVTSNHADRMQSYIHTYTHHKQRDQFRITCSNLDTLPAGAFVASTATCMHTAWCPMLRTLSKSLLITAISLTKAWQKVLSYIILQIYPGIAQSSSLLHHWLSLFAFWSQRALITDQPYITHSSERVNVVSHLHYYPHAHACWWWGRKGQRPLKQSVQTGLGRGTQAWVH